MEFYARVQVKKGIKTKVTKVYLKYNAVSNTLSFLYLL